LTLKWLREWTHSSNLRHRAAVFGRYVTIMKKQLFIAAALALTPSASFASEPVAESLAYGAYIGGIPLGTLHLKIAMDEERYATDARFDIAGLIRLFLDTDARASSEGALANGAVIPKSFDYWVRDGKKQRNTEMIFDVSGNATEVRADPAFKKRSYDLALDQVQGAIDPATAVAMLSAPRDTACDVDMTVFDGRKLHRITMEPLSASNETPRCTGRYERLAGFKAKYMTPERRSYPFKAELKQIAPNRWRPFRITARTKFGNAVALLEKK